MSGRKYDRGKPNWYLVPWLELESVVSVLTFGAEKYSKDNWKHVEDAQERYYAAAIRHLVARRSGEMNDPESGLPHMAHAICCILFHMWFDSKEESINE